MLLADNREEKMIRRCGDIFSTRSDVLLVTTNEYIRRDGCLVMGRGAAYTFSMKYSGATREFGDLVTAHASAFPNQPYGIILSPKWKSPVLGIFQVKRHFRDEADLGLIEGSANMLAAYAEIHPNQLIAVNFPGIGNGRLREKDVLPIIEILPRNVEVWTYAE